MSDKWKYNQENCTIERSANALWSLLYMLGVPKNTTLKGEHYFGTHTVFEYGDGSVFISIQPYDARPSPGEEEALVKTWSETDIKPNDVE